MYVDEMGTKVVVNIKAIKIDTQKILYERVNRGMSARELASKAGISKNVITNIERGYVVPRLQTVGKIANALGKKVEDFILKEESA